MSKEKRALVTGASRGLGRRIAELFAKEGFDIIAPNRSELELSDAVSVERYAARLPDIDILVNNAGENRPLPLDDITLSDLQRILTVNVTAPFLLARYAGPAMGRLSGGKIVNISSIYGLISRAHRSMYSASKAALDGMTRALAVELGPKKVLVNSVCPGFIDTDLTRQNNTEEELRLLCDSVPLRRLAIVEEIANLVYFLCSEKNTYITGQSVIIDGGFSCQ